MGESVILTISRRIIKFRGDQFKRSSAAPTHVLERRCNTLLDRIKKVMRIYYEPVSHMALPDYQKMKRDVESFIDKFPYLAKNYTSQLPPRMVEVPPRMVEVDR